MPSCRCTEAELSTIEYYIGTTAMVAMNDISMGLGFLHLFFVLNVEAGIYLKFIYNISTLPFLGLCYRLFFLDVAA